MAFFELNIAMTGLFSAQKGLQVTSNNISNANTKGYSRQVITQTASRPISGLGVGMTGTGSIVTSVDRVRDSYIDMKLWKQNGTLGEYNVKVTQSSVIESVFGEPSDSGFTKIFNNLFTSIDNLSKDASSSDCQSALKEELISFSTYYNNIASSIESFKDDLNTDIKSTVQEINNLADRIQSLNKQIFQAEIYGNEASSFRDERDVCLDRLSEIINVDVSESEVKVDGEPVKDPNGKPVMKMTVNIAGQVLVEHFHANNLSTSLDTNGMHQISWNTGLSFEMSDENMSGELKGLIDMRDGVGTVDGHVYNDKIKEQVDQINSLLNKITDPTTSATKRDELIEKLGGMINVQVDRATGDVSFAGRKLIENNTVVNSLKVSGAATDKQYVAWDDAEGKIINLQEDGIKGSLRNIFDTRDNTTSYNGMPFYVNQLNTYVRTFAQSMNETYSKDKDGHIEIADGVTVEVAGTTYAVSSVEKDEAGNVVACYYKDATGKKQKVNGMTAEKLKEVSEKYTSKYKLFSYSTGNGIASTTSGADLTAEGYEKITAENFCIAKDVYENIENFRISYDETDKSDGSIWTGIGALKDYKEMFKQGDPKDYMVAIFSKLGVNAQQAEMYQSTQTAVTKNIINQRLSVSQVDTSEEFAFLIKYQQAYQAAAKILTTIDGIYETTIFKLGNF